jgi:hypothetical protein
MNKLFKKLPRNLLKYLWRKMDFMALFYKGMIVSHRSIRIGEYGFLQYKMFNS